MKAVAIYYPSLEHSGGIERVVVELCRIFSEKDYPCTLVTDVSPQFYKNRIQVSAAILPDGEDARGNCWRNIIVENEISYVITNGGFKKSWQQDINCIHGAGAKVINTVHFSFPSPILFNEAWASFKNVQQIGQACDAVATVSRIDVLWWRALGCNAHYVQNPFTFYKHDESLSVPNNHTIIWVGRGVLQKQPLEAIKILRKVVKAIPDTQLIMVGLEDGGKHFQSVVSKWGLEGNVTFVAPTSEVGDYYQKASLHLLTSITESFCLVIAEAKSYRIPTVMYDIPFLELIEDGKGVEVIKQRDSDAAADSIVKMFKNPALLQQKGDEAYSTLERFNDDEVINHWQRIFDSLEKMEFHKPDCSNPYETIIREVYSAWMNHCEQNVWKIEFFDNLERATGRSAKVFVEIITNRVMNSLKSIKRKFR